MFKKCSEYPVTNGLIKRTLSQTEIPNGKKIKYNFSWILLNNKDNANTGNNEHKAPTKIITNLQKTRVSYSPKDIAESKKILSYMDLCSLLSPKKNSTEAVPSEVESNKTFQKILSCMDLCSLLSPKRTIDTTINTEDVTSESEDSRFIEF